MRFSLIEGSYFALCQMSCVFFKQQLNLTIFRRPGSLKGVACFKKQAELNPCKSRSKSPTSSNLTFNRLSNSNVKVLTISLGLLCLC